jgi:hypothetical protein
MHPLRIWRVFGCSCNMRWQHFKDSWAKSIKPFDTLTAKLAFPISIVAGLVLTHCITEDWGSFMTWWAIGIPGIVWLIYFVWNVANFHHKIHKDRTPALITILIFIGVTLAILVSVELSKISQLRSQISPSNSPPVHFDTRPATKSESTPQPSLALASQSAKQFKPIYTGHTDLGGTNSDDLLAKIEAEQKAKTNAQYEIDVAEADRLWKTNWPYYDYIIRTFLDFLDESAKQCGDSVVAYSPSPTFSSCLPQNMSFQVKETNLAELKFSKNTNWDFKIIVCAQDAQKRRPLTIKSDGGTLYFNTDFWRNPNELAIRLTDHDGKIIYGEGYPIIPIGERQTNIDTGLSAIIRLHKKYLSNTNN